MLEHDNVDLMQELSPIDFWNILESVKKEVELIADFWKILESVKKEVESDGQERGQTIDLSCHSDSRIFPESARTCLLI